MSQASKQVDWCLRKAEKEIEECKKLGKRQKHRGLLKISPNREEAGEHLKKSEENLSFATSLDSEKHGYKIIESIFYCMYHSFLAIAAKFGYESGNQTCTIALVEYLKEVNKIDLDQKLIEMMKYKDKQKDQEHLSIIEMREDYTYSAKISVEKERLEKLIEICKELVHITKDIVYR
jgi:uncharacterized protein (UPF0332 family)